MLLNNTLAGIIDESESLFHHYLCHYVPKKYWGKIRGISIHCIRDFISHTHFTAIYNEHVIADISIDDFPRLVMSDMCAKDISKALIHSMICGARKNNKILGFDIKLIE
jgi:hypothetical protein